MNLGIEEAGELLALLHHLKPVIADSNDDGARQAWQEAIALVESGVAQSVAPQDSGQWLSYPEHIPPRGGAYLVRLEDNSQRTDKWHSNFEWHDHPLGVCAFYVRFA